MQIAIKQIFTYFFSLVIVCTYSLSNASTNTEKQNVKQLNQNAADFLHKDPNLSLTLAKSALNLAVKYKDREAEAQSLFNIGMAFYIKGVYAKALEYHFQSKKVAERIENKKYLGDAYIGIGLVYHDQGKTTLSKQYFNQSYINYVRANFEKGIAHSLNMLGYSYAKESNIDSAIFYYNKTLLICEKINDPEVLASVYQDIANSFLLLQNYNDAIKYHNTSLKYGYLTGSSFNIAYSLNGLGDAHVKLNKIAEAEKNYLTALKIETENDLKPLMEKTYSGLTEINILRNNYKKAFEYQKLYTTLKDSLFSAKTNNTIAVLESDLVKEKEWAKTLFLVKENLYQEQELKREKRIKNFYIGIMFLALLNFLLLFNRFNVKKTSNELLRKKNRKISKQKRSIETINRELDKKSKSINDSIEYALKIQTALMPEERLLRKQFSNVVLIHNTLKTVSGDFYWSYENDNYIYLVVADCTGHGVPGAFMSIVGINTLNQLIVEKQLVSSGEIIALMDKQIRLSLKQDDNNIELGNSMDLVICVYNKNTNMLDFAGAKRPLLYFKNNEAMLVKGAHFSVGGNVGKEKTFAAHQIKLQKGDRFYLFTDGVTDQFGGEKGKRFMTRNLVHLITAIQSKPFEIQQIEINRAILSWKKDQEQIDDQLLIGVEI